jgi:sugar phosphate isomerase/epimerase
MGEVELMALYWTIAGPADVHTGREWSLFEWRDRCQEAAKVGYKGIGLWHADIEHQLETRTLREMKKIFDDSGLKYLQLEFIDNFWLPEGDPLRTASDLRRDMLFDAAAEFDALHIKVGNIPGTPATIPQLTDAFAELCTHARNRGGGVDIVYEFMPFDVNVQSLETAVKMVKHADQPNGGLAIDTWHMAKLGIEPEHLRMCPRKYLMWVELSDGQWENMEDPIDEVVNHRNLPGEGQFPIREYVRVCQQMGYDKPWGVEVLSEDLRSLPIEEEFKRSYETTAAQFSAAVA